MSTRLDLPNEHYWLSANSWPERLKEGFDLQFEMAEKLSIEQKNR